MGGFFVFDAVPCRALSGGGSYLRVTIQANGEAVITPEQ